MPTLVYLDVATLSLGNGHRRKSPRRSRGSGSNLPLSVNVPGLRWLPWAVGWLGGLVADDRTLHGCRSWLAVGTLVPGGLHAHGQHRFYERCAGRPPVKRLGSCSMPDRTQTDGAEVASLAPC